MKFRKKPVIIEAITVDEVLISAERAWSQLPEWLKEAYDDANVVFMPDGLSIRTLEGVMTAQRGDWIIRGIKNELYPCRNDIFLATYELVEEPPTVFELEAKEQTC